MLAVLEADLRELSRLARRKHAQVKEAAERGLLLLRSLEDAPNALQGECVCMLAFGFVRVPIPSPPLLWACFVMYTC